MKISVITVHTSFNYGTVLQTYATQTLLENMGHTVEFADYWRKSNQLEGRVDSMLGMPKLQKCKAVWDRNTFTRRLVRVPLRILLRHIRALFRMDDFLKKYIHFSRRYLSYEALVDDPPIADIYMTGSDQVWNRIWNDGIDKAYYLGYAPAGKPRIAYAASIGRTELDDDEIGPMRDMLQKYDAISMREQSGVELLQTLGIASELVLDPTLMLTAQEWRAIAKPFRHKRPYLLVYKLGKDTQMDTYAQLLSEQLGLEIVRIAIFKPQKGENIRWVVRPKAEELLGCFDGAAFILTNSFHGTAFSLNLGKPFFSVMPNRFATRLQSICTLTGTTARVVACEADLAMAEQPIDNTRVQSILEAERAKSMRFLQNALDGRGIKHD